MAKDYTQLANEIIKNVGGEDNVISLAHCVTRLRFKLRDDKKVNVEALKEINGVLKVMIAGGQHQVVIGTEVADVFDTILRLYNIKGQGEVEAEDEGTEEKKQGFFNKFVDLISGIFMPFMGAFAGAGLLKGFLILFTTMGWLDQASTTYSILFSAADSAFYFMPIFLGYCAGKKFGANPFISMGIAAAMCHPTITALNGSETPVTFMGIPVQMINYTSSVLPIIVTAYVQSVMEKVLNKWIPKMVRGIFVPILDLGLLVPLAFIVIGPVTSIAGNFVAGIIQNLLGLSPLIAGFALAAGWPVMILFGIHWAFIPIVMNNYAVLGYDYILPITVGANFGIAAACIAVFLKTKNNELKQVSGAASISALIGGVTEPGVYGVLLKNKRTFTLVCLINGIGGAICAVAGVTRTAQVSVSLLTIPAIYAMCGIYAIIAMAISFFGALVVTYLFGYSDKMIQAK